MMFQMNVDFGAGAISFGGGTSEWWVQLSTAVVFGLAFSTFMTLVATPVWLAAPERLAAFLSKLQNNSPLAGRNLFGKHVQDETADNPDVPLDEDIVRPAAE